MIYRLILSAFLGLVVAFPVLAAAQDQYQYASFTEVESVNRQGERLITLNFSTDPGYPITVIGEASAVDPRESAYTAFYKAMDWHDANEHDVIYVLNRAGRAGIPPTAFNTRCTVFVEQRATAAASSKLCPSLMSRRTANRSSRVSRTPRMRFTATRNTSTVPCHLRFL